MLVRDKIKAPVLKECDLSPRELAVQVTAAEYTYKNGSKYVQISTPPVEPYPQRRKYPIEKLPFHGQ